MSKQHVASVHIVRDVFNNTTKLMSVTMLPLKVVLEIKEKFVGFCEPVQSLKDDFLSNFTRRREKSDWPMSGGVLWRLS